MAEAGTLTLLVTGATGEIGGSLLARLARGGEVRALTRRRRGGEGAWRWVEGDLLEPESLRRACAGVERVVHMAAVTHARRAAAYQRVNVDGTAHLLAAAEEAGVRRFVHLSSRAVGAAGGSYSRSKELAEERVRSSALEWVILRPAEVYGGAGGDAVTTLARSLRDGRFVPILGDGSYKLSPVHVEDVVEAVAAAAERPGIGRRTYVVAGPEEMSYLELVSRLERALGVEPRRRLRVPVALARLAVGVAGRMGIGGYVPDQIPRLLLAKESDSSAAARDLGFAPRTLEQGLERAL